MPEVSFATKLSNNALPGKMIAPFVSPAFVKTSVMLNLSALTDLPAKGQGNAVSFRKLGSLTDNGVLAEATDFTIDGDGELTDTLVDLTAGKMVVISIPTVETERFGTIDIPRIIGEQAAALARGVDNTQIALFTSFSNSVTSASGGAGIDELLDAQFYILDSECPQDQPLQFVGNAKSIVKLRREVLANGGSAWQNPMMLDIIAGRPNPNGFIGNIPGVGGVWLTSGFGTSGADDIQALLHPQLAVGIALDRIPTVWAVKVVSGGFYSEVGSIMFFDTDIINNAAGVKILADT